MLKKKVIAVLILMAIIIAFFFTAAGCSGPKKPAGLAMAVEYNTHAACAYIAQSKGWLSEKGYDGETFDVYATGVALAGALTKGSIDAAYICLVPAISAYANAGVPIKIVCGTHKYGYALVVDSSKIKRVEDLEKNGVKIGCVREGANTDILLNKIIDYYGLNRQKVLGNVVRMNPVKQIMAAETGKLDAVVVPEHFAALAEYKIGFNMLVKSQDVWPQMQGSVLVVTERFLSERPEAVKDLFEITSAATDFINEYPLEAAKIVADKLNAFRETVVDLEELTGENGNFGVVPDLISYSMANLEYTTQINEEAVQEVIDFMFELGYIKERFQASDILLERDYFARE